MDFFRRNIKAIIKWSFLLTIPSALIFTMRCLSPSLVSLQTLYQITNNSTFAVIVGFFALRFGYHLWRKQHDQELKDLYFQEALQSMMREISIKNERILAFQQSTGQEDLSGRLDKLLSKHLEISGRFETYGLLLESLGDDRVNKLLSINIEYSEKYLELNNNMPDILTKEYYDKFTELHQKTRRQLLKFVRSEKK